MSDIEVDERRGNTSASNAEADLRCPGRHLAQRGIARPPASKDADRGTRIHAALASRNPTGLAADEAATYERCIEQEVKKVKEFFGADCPTNQLRSWPEQRFWVVFREQTSPNGSPPQVAVYEHSAKPDRVYRYGTRALVIEYKTLMGEVPESPRNLQLRDQAVIIRGHFLVDEVGTVVIQPMVQQDPAICLYGKDDLDRSYQELFRRVKASNDPNSPRVPGDAQCKFCLANTSCLEYQRWAGAMVPNMLSVLDVPVKDWTPDQRKIFCDRYDAAQKWLNTCWAAMEEGASRVPDFVPGYAMKAGAERQDIINPQMVFERFLAKGGEAKAFMKAVKVTKTPLKEEVKALTGTTGKRLDGVMAEMLEGATETRHNKASLKAV